MTTLNIRTRQRQVSYLLKNKPNLNTSPKFSSKFFSNTAYIALPVITSTIGAVSGVYVTAYLHQKWVNKGFLNKNSFFILRILLTTYASAVVGCSAGFLVGLVPYILSNLPKDAIIRALLVALGNGVGYDEPSPLADTRESDAFIIFLVFTLTCFSTVLVLFFITNMLKNLQVLLEFSILVASSGLFLFFFVKFVFFLVYIAYKIFIFSDALAINYLAMLTLNFFDQTGLAFTPWEIEDLQTAQALSMHKKALEVDLAASNWWPVAHSHDCSNLQKTEALISTGSYILFSMLSFLSFGEFFSVCNTFFHEISPLSFFFPGPWSAHTYGSFNMPFKPYALQSLVSWYIVSTAAPFDSIDTFHLTSVLDSMTTAVNFLAPALNAASGGLVFTTASSFAQSYIFVTLVIDLLFSFGLLWAVRNNPDFVDNIKKWVTRPNL